MAITEINCQIGNQCMSVGNEDIHSFANTITQGILANKYSWDIKY